jgi:hypothetical protein
MTGPSDTAYLTAARVMSSGEWLEAVYPIIRADVIAEVVAALRKRARHMGTRGDTADFIEREFGGES